MLDPVISFLGIYLKKTKSVFQKDICTPCSSETLLIIAKIWRQPSVHIKIKFILKMRYTHICTNGKLLFSHKKKEIPPFATA